MGTLETLITLTATIGAVGIMMQLIESKRPNKDKPDIYTAFLELAFVIITATCTLFLPFFVLLQKIIEARWK